MDGETIAQFAPHADEKLNLLRRSVGGGTYKPLPLLQFHVPKKSGGWRELAVPTVRDRIVQQALLNILHPILEPQFEGCSYAYRPGRSHLMAVRQVDYWHRQGYDWILDADLIQYFDNVQHSRLLAEVSERLQTKHLKRSAQAVLHQPQVQPSFAKLALSLIEQWISIRLLTSEGLVLREKGVAQGSVISPILSNIYLDDFDELLSATELKLVRFADDFVLLGRREKALCEGKAFASQLLDGMGLRLHPDKTQITNFKRGFRFLGHTFVGELVVPNQKAQQPKEKRIESVSYQLVHADAALGPTPMQQALVEALRRTQKPIPPPLYVVFGYKVREASSVKISSQELFWNTGMSTLYLVRQGTMLRKEQGRFLVKTQEAEDQPLKTMEVPIQEVERVLVFGNVQLSTTAISSCLEAKIPVIFLTQWGDYKGHLWSAEYCDLEVEAAQFQKRVDEGFKQAVARQVVLGKLANCKHLLLRLNRKRGSEVVSKTILGISAVQGKLSDMEVLTLDQIRGYEGAASKDYFAALGALITNEGFTLTERNRRPPKDPVNSLLSFGYVLLFHNVLSLILAEGLNPYIGNLHGSDRKEAFLAFDLMEEFRSPVVDTLVMQLVNQKVLRPTDFTWPDEKGGIYLLEPGKRVFLKNFEQRISKAIKHPDATEEVSYRRVIQLQIQRYKKTLLDGVAYEPFRRIG